MADLGFLGGFNANDEEYNSDFDLIKVGDYNVIIEDSELVANKQGTGEIINVKLRIVDAPYEGRIIFDRFNLIHTNPEAVKIAKKQWAALCRAAGVFSPSNSSELHGSELVATIGVQKNGEYNEVKRYKTSEPGEHITPEKVQPKDVPVPPKKTRKSKAKPADTVPTPEGDFDDDIPF